MRSFIFILQYIKRFLKHKILQRFMVVPGRKGGIFDCGKKMDGGNFVGLIVSLPLWFLPLVVL